MQAERVSLRQKSLYIKFKDINSRNEAEALRNKEISISKQLLQNYLQDEILVDDLIGMALYDEKGSFVGQIVDYENYGASDILTVLENGHEYQVPFISDVFVIEKNNISVDRKAYNENKI